MAVPKKFYNMEQPVTRNKYGYPRLDYANGDAQTTEQDAHLNRIGASCVEKEAAANSGVGTYIRTARSTWAKAPINSIYIIGSLRNTKVPEVGDKLRASGYEAFDQWYSAGPEADDHFKQYHIDRGNSYSKALESYAARHIFNFDKTHLDRCDAAIIVLPGGRSAHLELGYIIGTGKPGYVLLDNESDRWDLMYQFASGIYSSVEDLIKELEHDRHGEVSKAEVL